jgi:hypothetical protein
MKNKTTITRSEVEALYELCGEIESLVAADDECIIPTKVINLLDQASQILLGLIRELDCE